MDRRPPFRRRLSLRVYSHRALAVCAALLSPLACAACSVASAGTQSLAAQSSSSSSGTSTSTTTAASITSATSSSASTSATGSALPGTGKPPVTIGDKNYTEQFVLGELYRLALQAQGYTVNLNQNIGPTSVTLQAMKSGSLAMYPEYLNLFDTVVARYRHGFRTRMDAYHAAQRYALAHGLVLLSPTPFSDTGAIGVTVGYAQANHLHSLEDLARVAATITLGGPPETGQSMPSLSTVEQAYGFTPQAFKPLAVGAQYAALVDGSVQAAEMQTTDGQLASGDYRLLADPFNVFGWGNVVPVVTARTLGAEGPAFAATINKVDAALTLPVMQELNQAVDIAGQNPATVAQQFLVTHGLIPVTPP